MKRVLVVFGLALGLAACGGAAKSKPDLVVSAASSLKAAFTHYAEQFSQAKVRYSFGGSDLLAAQIQQGVKPDVFASANTKLPDMLYAKGLVAKPVTFASMVEERCAPSKLPFAWFTLVAAMASRRSSSVSP